MPTHLLRVPVGGDPCELSEEADGDMPLVTKCVFFFVGVQCHSCSLQVYKQSLGPNVQLALGLSALVAYQALTIEN